MDEKKKEEGRIRRRRGGEGGGIGRGGEWRSISRKSWGIGCSRNKLEETTDLLLSMMMAGPVILWAGRSLLSR